MTRRALCLGVVLALVAAVHAIAAAPEGPRLALVEFGSKPSRLVLNSVDASGEQPLRIAGGGKRTRPLPMLLDGPSWSGDGSSIAFTGIGGKVEGTSGFALEGTQLYVVGADGTGLRAVPGTTEGHGPVFSPDGRTIAFTRARERKAEDPRRRREGPLPKLVRVACRRRRQRVDPADAVAERPAHDCQLVLSRRLDPLRVPGKA